MPAHSRATGRGSIEWGIGANLPFRSYQGQVSLYGAPKIGDEVVCVFNENVFGRTAEEWEARSITKHTPKTRERVLKSLTKAWLHR